MVGEGGAALEVVYFVTAAKKINTKFAERQ